MRIIRLLKGNINSCQLFNIIIIVISAFGKLQPILNCPSYFIITSFPYIFHAGKAEFHTFCDKKNSVTYFKNYQTIILTIYKLADFWTFKRKFFLCIVFSIGTRPSPIEPHCQFVRKQKLHNIHGCPSYTTTTNRGNTISLKFRNPY